MSPRPHPHSLSRATPGESLDQRADGSCNTPTHTSPSRPGGGGGGNGGGGDGGGGGVDGGANALKNAPEGDALSRALFSWSLWRCGAGGCMYVTGGEVIKL